MEQKEKKESKVEKFEYYIQMLDNGIVLSQPEYDSIECEKFSDTGRPSDKAMQVYVGQHFWEDIVCTMDRLMSNKVKVVLTIEEDT